MKTFTKILSGAALLSVAALASCQRTGVEEGLLVNPLDARDGSFSIVGNLNDFQTRAHDAVWEADDKIGVFALNPGETTIFNNFANLQYATVDASGVFKASNGGVVLTKEDKADVAAYYPYAAGLQGTTYDINLATQTPLKNIDLLWGKGTLTADVNTSTVPVKFNHKLSLVQIRFAAKDGIKLPSSIKAAFKGMTTQGTLDAATGALTPGSAKGNLELTAANNAIDLILMPGDVLSAIDFTFDGFTVPYTFDTPFTLAEDTKYILTFTPYADGSAVVLSLQSSIEDWGNEVTFTDEIPYGAGEESGGEEPGGEEPDPVDPVEPDEPDTPTLSLAFPGADFETDPDVGKFGYKDATIEAGVGIDGSKALHISGTPGGNNYIFSTPSSNAKAGETYTSITFWIKGTATGKSLSINVYDADGKYWGFNLGDVTGSKTVTAKGTTADGGFVNDYNGTIDTGGQWIQITLDIAGLAINTSGSGNFIAFKDGKEAPYDLYLDNIELK